MSWPSAQKNVPRGDPTVAAVLTWILPGAGHFYLGMPVFGLVAFLVVQGLYWIGLQLSHGMLFEYLEPDLRSAFAGVLTPEVGNLGGLVYHMKTYGYGLPFMRPWPDAMWIGCWMTACSGIVNACLMVRAHSDARAPKNAADPGFARIAPPVLAAWALPGLGHWMQGRKLRGVLFFVLLVGLLVLGTALAEGSNLSRERHFYYWAGQFLAGLPGLVLEGLFGRGAVTHDIAYADAGLDLACLAGLLNVLALMDVYAYGEKRALEPQPEPTTQAAAPSAVNAP
ncbi:MAG: hypothetical protein IPJ19_08880 [Planctomycetes bacterium]|nr:hypothetical protein [Planctomycetota bacterium]